MRRKLGDRRNRPRYDVVGDLWGTLETVLSLPLRNVSRGGALIESRVPLPDQSIHRLMFACEGQDETAQVRVRHVSSVLAPDGKRTYLIGVEFLSVPPPVLGTISRWLATGPDAAAAAAEV